ncbi:MAG TPA: hypothetical protein VFY17_04590 [Pilimelia sp.]|nr:hypothetical protein [Pilimelia sp.]
MADEEMYCAVCGTDRVFSTVRGADRKDGAAVGEPGGDDDPELLCRGCGTVIMIAPVVVWGLGVRGPRWSAPHQRGAA